jgi:hypothetical protein
VTLLTFIGFARLAGILPPSIGTLVLLEMLDLHANDLQGPIPDLSGMARLLILNLSSNRFTGPVPEGLSQLTGMKSLALAHNELRGPLPPGFSALQYLERFHVQHNRLTGPVPAQLLARGAKIPYYEVALTGNKGLCLPARMDEGVEVGRVVSLQLPNQGLHGKIPLSIGALIALIHLDLSMNKLTGAWNTLILLRSDLMHGFCMPH